MAVSSPACSPMSLEWLLPSWGISFPCMYAILHYSSYTFRVHLTPDVKPWGLRGTTTVHPSFFYACTNAVNAVAPRTGNPYSLLTHTPQSAAAGSDARNPRLARRRRLRIQIHACVRLCVCASVRVREAQTALTNEVPDVASVTKVLSQNFHEMALTDIYAYIYIYIYV